MTTKHTPHPGRRNQVSCLDPLGRTVTEAAGVLSMARHTLALALNGHE